MCKDQKLESVIGTTKYNPCNRKLIEITIEDIKGNDKIISVSYKQLVKDAKIGVSNI